MDLLLDTRMTGATTTVVVGGTLDLDTAGGLRRLLVDVIDAGAPQVYLDLEALEYIDSTGLGVLASGFKRARQAGTDFALACRPDHTVRKVLRLTRLDEVIAIHDSPPSTTSA